VTHLGKRPVPVAPAVIGGNEISLSTVLIGITLFVCLVVGVLFMLPLRTVKSPVPVQAAAIPTIPAVATTASHKAVTQYTAKQTSMICRAGIAAEFGRDPKIMTAKTIDSGLMRVSYRRPDDRTLWKSDCRIEGDRIVWRTVDASPGSGPGRWRTGEYDDVLTFAIKGKSVTTHSSDGSSASDTY
jgi:hypothetical protein